MPKTQWEYRIDADTDVFGLTVSAFDAQDAACKAAEAYDDEHYLSKDERNGVLISVRPVGSTEHGQFLCRARHSITYHAKPFRPA